MAADSGLILAGDIGGTHARFGCLERTASGGWDVHNFSKLKTADFPTFDDALRAYLSKLDTRPTRAAFAAAGPVEAGYVKLTNIDWEISADRAKRLCGFEICALYNDFAGMTRSVAELPDKDFRELRAGRAYTDAPILVAGAGTGFGVGYLIPINNRSAAPKWHVMSTEGGRVAYSPQSSLEFELSQVLRREHDVITLELINSGKALTKVHRAVCEIHGVVYEAMSPDLIRAQAQAKDPICLDLCNIRAAATMGAIGDFVLSGGARGGIVLAGGVSERMVDFYMEPHNMARYLKRGALSDYVKGIPMRLLRSPLAPLIGAAALLHER